MNKETFAKYISNPTLLDNDSLPEIKAMLDEFPYFQSAWVLYIKNLHAIKDIRYENKLKTACAYISDRKHLHDILKGAYIPAIAPVQTQGLASQQEEIAEDTTAVQTQFIASQPEKEIADTEIQRSSTSTTPSEQDITQDITTETKADDNVQTQFIASQEEENDTVQTQNLASQPETPASPEPDKPESLADRILRQAEEMRKAKAAAAAEAYTENQNSESPVETQCIASQPEDTISQSEEIATVQPQNIVSQPEDIPEDTSIVETQDIASQEEDTISQPEEIATVQPQNIVSQPEDIPEDTSIVKTQDIASQEEDTISQSEEIATVQPQNLVAQPDEIAEDASQGESKEEIPEQEESNVKTQNFVSQEITTAQIKALLEKQLHDIGINANITFSGNSANIQFENIATCENTDGNPPEQTFDDNEQPATEIITTPNIDEQIEKRKNDRDKKANLIDKFIESKARIVPKKDYHSDNKLSTESIIEDEELFTEQLAKIYIKQGHLEKALETYEKLYLKYPEKNIYFATRIEYVKRLMNK